MNTHPATNPAPHEALLAALGVRPEQVVPALIDKPLWASGQPNPVTRLFHEVPISTPFGACTMTVFRDPAHTPSDSDYRGDLIADLSIPAGGSFVVNGVQYAPAEGGFLSSRTISVYAVRPNRPNGHPEHDKTLTRVDSYELRVGHDLTASAARKIAAWWDADGRALVTPLMVAARRLAETSQTAHRLRDAAENAEAVARAARADANTAARNLAEASAAFVRLSAEANR